MAWPTPQDYNEAVQNPKYCFPDKELSEGIVETDQRGLPRAVCGAFASVYRVTTNGKDYAVRCFLNDMPDQQLRYERLAEAISADLLDATVDFEYQPHGLIFGKKAFPIVKMQWVKGFNLDSYVEQILPNAIAMTTLRDQFRKLVAGLRNEGFAHGDLQHGNILVTEAGLRLVDYDGMYVPQLTGLPSNELGHRNFQHPARTGQHFGPYLDNFSAWVMDTALTCLIEDSTVYNQFKNGEGLVFRREDFVDPDSSELFYWLETHASSSIRAASRRFRTIIACNPMNVPPICLAVPESAEHPLVTRAREVAAALQKRQEAEALAAKLEQERVEQLRLEQEQVLEEQRRQEAQRQFETHAKPEWLDNETAHALSQIDKATAKTAQAVGHADALSNGESIDALQSGAHAPAVRNNTAPMPTAQVYAEHIQRSVHGLLDGTVAAVTLELENGMPKNYGDQNAVFHCSIGNRSNALKLFCQPMESPVRRFQIIIKALERAGKTTDVFLPIKLSAQAANVGGVWYPGVTMPWVQASNLAEVMRTTKADFDYTLLRQFRQMMRSLRTSNLAHGKLELSNILVYARPKSTESHLLLVDYDNLCAPELLANNMGAAYPISSGFRHPLASADEFNLKMDNFPAWLIDTALLVWSFDRVLFHRLCSKPELPILDGDDFKAPGKSYRLRVLSKHSTPEISERAHLLLTLIQSKPDSVPHLPLDGAIPNF